MRLPCSLEISCAQGKELVCLTARCALPLRGDRPEETRLKEVRSPLSGVYGDLCTARKRFLW